MHTEWLSTCRVVWLQYLLVMACVVSTASTAFSQVSGLAPQDYIDLLAVGVGSVETASAHFQGYTQLALERGGEQCELDGFGLAYDWDWKWRRTDAAELLVGRQGGYLEDGLWEYTIDQFAYDGVLVRAMSPANERGVIRELEMEFSGIGTPRFFFGDSLCRGMRTRPLAKLLQGAQFESAAESYPGCVVVGAEFDDVGPFGDFGRRHVQVWIDSQCGYLPRRIEVSDSLCGTVTHTLMVEQFTESAGVWFPIRMWQNVETVARFEFPTSITEERFRTLPWCEKQRYHQEMDIQKSPLGMSPFHYHVAPETLVINEPIPLENFQPEFPAGYRVFDSIKNTESVVGADHHSENRNRGVNWGVYVVLNSAILLAIAVVFVAKNRMVKK